jgi:endonuclease G
MPKRYTKRVVQRAITELDRVREAWLRRPGVTGVDVGYRMVDHTRTDELAIRVHVEDRRPVDAMDAVSFTAPGSEPGHLGEFRLDFIEAKYAPAMPHADGTTDEAAVNRRSRIEPLVGGISVGNPRATAGTLGAVVWDRQTGEPCILSNWHVLCGSSQCVEGEAIWQPGRLDGGDEEDVVAHLYRWLLDRDADAALAKLTDARPYVRDLLELQPVAGIEPNPRLGLKVCKSGRTTGVTHGLIDGVSLSLSLNYSSGERVIFHDQLRIVPEAPWPEEPYELSKGGDSGSIWVTQAGGRAVGLHFAGETDDRPASEYAVANRMVKVAELLDFSFTPVFAGRREPPDEEPRPVTGPIRPVAGRRPRGALRAAIRRIICRAIPPLCMPGGIDFAAGETAPEVDVEALIDQIIDEMENPR